MTMFKRTITLTRPSTSVPWYQSSQASMNARNSVEQNTTTMSSDGLQFTIVTILDQQEYDSLQNIQAVSEDRQALADYEQENGIIRNISIEPL